MKVADVMTADPLTVTPAETVGQADEIISENHFRQIPVVKNKKVVGIITDWDMLSRANAGGLKRRRNHEERQRKSRTRDHDGFPP